MKKILLFSLLFVMSSLSEIMALPLITKGSLSKKNIDKIQNMMESNVPVWIIVLVVGLIVLFTFLLLFSYKGSRKNRKKKKTIFR